MHIQQQHNVDSSPLGSPEQLMGPSGADLEAAADALEVAQTEAQVDRMMIAFERCDVVSTLSRDDEGSESAASFGKFALDDADVPFAYDIDNLCDFVCFEDELE
jgi:hypothetical protein